MSVDTNAQTSVQQVDLDIDSWLGSPGADSIITPAEPAAKAAEPGKPNMFARNTTDISFLDDEDEDEDDDEGNTKADAKKAAPTAADVASLVDDFAKADDDDDDSAPAGKAGRPKTEKSSLVNFLKKRIESKEMFAFDDFDEEKQTLDEYLGTLGEKDVEELWQANIDTMKKEVAAKTPQEFFEALPEELQHAARYVMNGGQDMKSMFRALAQVEEVRELDPTQDTDQEQIVRQYLVTTGYGDGDQELIEDEIQTWKDLGKLETKAKQFKPKLDKMQEEQVTAQIAQQERRKEQQEEAAQAYMSNVFEALRPGEINGLKLDKKTQATLYNGLVNPEYPSISGRGTNMLGHLLEKYQYVEPNYPLIAEALWLLSNPDEYRDSLKKQGGNQATEKTVRQLKTEQSKKIGSTNTFDDDAPSGRKLPRQQNIFKR
jgi:hypothetical protein